MEEKWRKCMGVEHGGDSLRNPVILAEGGTQFGTLPAAITTILDLIDQLAPAHRALLLAAMGDRRAAA